MHNEDIVSIISKYGDYAYNMGLMKRYPAPLTTVQEAFINRFKEINKWSQNIQDYEKKDKEEHESIVANVQ